MVTTFPRKKWGLFPYDKSSESTESMPSWLDSPHMCLSFPTSQHLHNRELVLAGATGAWGVCKGCSSVSYLTAFEQRELFSLNHDWPALVSSWSSGPGEAGGCNHDNCHPAIRHIPLLGQFYFLNFPRGCKFMDNTKLGGPQSVSRRSHKYKLFYTLILWVNREWKMTIVLRSDPTLIFFIGNYCTEKAR